MKPNLKKLPAHKHLVTGQLEHEGMTLKFFELYRFKGAFLDKNRRTKLH